MDQSQVENFFCGQRNQTLRLFLKMMDASSSGLKRRGTIRLTLVRLGCISAYGTDAHLERVYTDFRATYAPIQATSFIFQQDNAKTRTASIKKAWLYSRRVQVLN